MDISRALEFLGTSHRAVLATYRPDGTAQLSPVLAAVDGAGAVVVSTRETAIKVKNLRSDPRAILCVLSDGFYGDWVYVEGTAEIVSLPAALEPLVDYYRAISGEHPDWADYRAAMQSERRVIVRIIATHAGPDFSG